MNTEVLLRSAGLLLVSNIFMTFAWYAHLKGGQESQKPLWFAILISWGIAFFEYVIMVPANRIGFNGGLRLDQLKVMQEVITLVVFVLFAKFYMGEKMRMDYLYAGLCLMGAVYFIFRGR